LVIGEKDGQRPVVRAGSIRAKNSARRWRLSQFRIHAPVLSHDPWLIFTQRLADPLYHSPRTRFRTRMT